MKASIYSAAVLFLMLFSHSAMTQDIYSSNTLLCPTSDGIVTIDNGTILLRDYTLTLESQSADGILHFRDNGSSAIAELDARSADGLYLTITEGGTTMQLVADRRTISASDEPSSTAPASPRHSGIHSAVIPQMSEAATRR